MAYHHSVSPTPHPAFGGLHAGWVSFGDLVTGTAATGTRGSRQSGIVRGWLRGLVSGLSRSPQGYERVREIPAYLRDDIGLDPLDAVSEPDAAGNDAAMWVGIKSGMHPRP